MGFLHRLLKKSSPEEQSIQQQPKGGDRLEPVRRLSGYSWLIIALGVFLIVGLWSFVYYQINADYDRSIAEASQETMNLTKSFEEHVRRIIADADKDLLSIRRTYERDGIASPVIAAAAQKTENDPSRGLGSGL